MAARDKAKAKAFAELHQVLKFYGSYEELAEDKKLNLFMVAQLTHFI